MGNLKHIPEHIGDRIPKVYFSCHKDDFKPYFKEISDDIMNGRSCIVFYDEDYDGKRDDKFYFDLSQMNLFVIPITTRLLTKPNRALDEELAFALEHKIPVLPLMQESGLEELFNKKFGDLQFLDKYNRDTTAISYDEKLNKYLSSVLLDDKTIKRIRAEFDAYIFLSYRKKDRIHANRLMRLIHKNDFCRDVAIWYDEFLTPGENFNKTIAEALDKSGLFVLAVTPSLLENRVDENGVEHKNYIEEHEYPMAVEAQKPILPTELIYTDKGVLAEKYANVPDCVDANDEAALTEALLNTAKKLVSDENDNSPEHNYLIGLAYLDGIDVEVDYARAREMIEFAANANHLEAIDKMIDMYSNGCGAKRNDDTAAQWYEKKIALLQKRYDENPNEDNANELFWALIMWSKKARDSRNILIRANQLCETFVVSSSSKMRRNLSVGYNAIGNEYRRWKTLGKSIDGRSIEYLEKALTISREIANESGSKQSKIDLASNYHDLGRAYKTMGREKQAKECYLEAYGIASELFEQTKSVKAKRELICICYGLYEVEDDKEKANCYFEMGAKLAEEIYSETGSASDLRVLIDWLIRTREHNGKKHSWFLNEKETEEMGENEWEGYYLHCVKILKLKETVYKKSKESQHGDSLATSLELFASTLRYRRLYDEAMKCLKRAEGIRRYIYAETADVTEKYGLSEVLYCMGDLLFCDIQKYEDAEKYFEEALKLTETEQTQKPPYSFSFNGVGSMRHEALAKTKRKLKKNNEAIALYKEALLIKIDLLSLAPVQSTFSTHNDTVRGILLSLFDVRNNIGEISLSLHNYYKIVVLDTWLIALIKQKGYPIENRVEISIGLLQESERLIKEDAERAAVYYGASKLFFDETLRLFDNEKDHQAITRTLFLKSIELGDLFQKHFQRTLAGACYKMSFAISEQLANETNTVEARRDLSLSYERLGNIYKAEGNIPKAKELYENTLAINEQLAQETNTVEARRNLSVIYNKLGNIYKAEGNIPKAKEYYEKALCIFVEFENQRRTVDDMLNTSYCCENLGLIFQAEGAFCEAKKYFFLLLEKKKTIANIKPSFETKHAVTLAHYLIAHEYVLEKDFEKAAEQYVMGEDTLEEIFKEPLWVLPPANPEKHTEIIRSCLVGYKKLGEIYETINNKEKAIFYYYKGLRVVERRLSISSASRTETKREISLLSEKLASLHTGVEKAYYLTKTKMVLKELIDMNPENNEFKEHLSVVQENLKKLKLTLLQKLKLIRMLKNN